MMISHKKDPLLTNQTQPVKVVGPVPPGWWIELAGFQPPQAPQKQNSWEPWDRNFFFGDFSGWITGEVMRLFLWTQKPKQRHGRTGGFYGPRNYPKRNGCCFFSEEDILNILAMFVFFRVTLKIIPKYYTWLTCVHIYLYTCRYRDIEREGERA